jgi:hypothetical protein
MNAPVYYCVFDGLSCRFFEALRRREGGLYFAVGCVVNKDDKNFHNCSRFVAERVGKRETHHCPFDGDFCKYVRGCQDALFFSNGLPLPQYCSRAKIRRKVRWS